jgi:hypothetical protein
MSARAPHAESSSGDPRSASRWLPGLALAFLAAGAVVRAVAGPTSADVV